MTTLLLEHFHNSAERHDPPKCHPRTREAIQQKILDWAMDPHNLRLLMWIYGPAGGGKSAIMQTIAERLEELGILGGSFFFFSTGNKRNEKTHLITTLAYQLSLIVPHLDNYIAATIDRDPSVFSRTLAVQMKKLIIEPMSSASHHDPRSNEWCYTMLVDGLDECSPPDSHREIITLLSSSASSHLRFVTASRPEFIIRDTFSSQIIAQQVQSLVLDDTYRPDADIRLFLTERFQDIKARHPAHHSIPDSWPGISIINTLVENSSGQFIYAATVIKFIESPEHNPMSRLDSVLHTGSTVGQSDMPFSQLDALYHHILASVADWKSVLQILLCILHLNEDDDMSFFVLQIIYGYQEGEAETILCGMHSLLNIPDGSDEDKSINFYHKSMSDFLLDHSRAKHLYIPPSDAITSILISLFKQFEGVSQ